MANVSRYFRIVARLCAMLLMFVSLNGYCGFPDLAQLSGDITVKVMDDGRLNVTEIYTISTKHTFPFTRIIRLGREGALNHTYTVSVESLTTTIDGKTVHPQQDDVTEFLALTSILKRGQHTVRYHYVVPANIIYRKNHDEIFHSVFYSQSEVQIQNLNAHIFLPNKSKFYHWQTYNNNTAIEDQLKYSKIEPNGDLLITSNSAKNLDEMSVSFAFPKGVVAEPSNLYQWIIRQYSDNLIGGLIVAVIVLLALFYDVLKRWAFVAFYNNAKLSARLPAYLVYYLYQSIKGRAVNPNHMVMVTLTYLAKSRAMSLKTKKKNGVKELDIKVNSNKNHQFSGKRKLGLSGWSVLYQLESQHGKPISYQDVQQWEAIYKKIMDHIKLTFTDFNVGTIFANKRSIKPFILAIGFFIGYVYVTNNMTSVLYDVVVSSSISLFFMAAFFVLHKLMHIENCATVKQKMLVALAMIITLATVCANYQLVDVFLFFSIVFLFIGLFYKREDFTRWGYHCFVVLEERKRQLKAKLGSDQIDIQQMMPELISYDLADDFPEVCEWLDGPMPTKEHTILSCQLDCTYAYHVTIVASISSFTLILVSGVSTPVTELLGRLLHFTGLIDMLF